MISIEVWKDERLWSEAWLDGDDEGIGSEIFEDALDALKYTANPGESFTLIARKMDDN